jgi:hypothetical protein
VNDFQATVIGYAEDGVSMLVRYEREGYCGIVVGCLLPPIGADLHHHLAMYAPLSQWAYEDAKRIGRWKPPLNETLRFGSNTKDVATVSEGG